MNLDLLLKNFDLIAEMPGGVARLRELILELAVSGKLVKQDPEDGNASDLIDRIVKDRNKNSTQMLEAEELVEDGLYALPKGWVWARFSSIATIATNLMSPYRFMNCKHLAPDNIEKATGRLLQCRTVCEDKVTSSNHYFYPGQIVYSKIRPNLSKAVIVNFEGLCSADMYPINSLIDTKFLHKFMLSKPFLRQAVRNDTRVAMPKINQTELNEIMVSVPPLAEQKRIVAKVDELMALCDQLDAQHAERHQRRQTLTRAAIARFTADPTIANLQYLFDPDYALDPEDLRKVILSLAVRGKLVRQMKEEGTGEACLKKMGIGFDSYAEREFLLDISVPKSWVLVRLDDIAIITGGVTLGRKLNPKNIVTLPYLRVANVKRGEIDLGVMKEVTISEEEVTRFSLKKNDLLLTEGGDWDKVGRAAVWHGQIDPCLHQNHVFRVRMRSEEIQPYWFERYINSPIGRAYFEGASKQTTNLASINMRQVRSCPVPFPPLAEQNRILKKINELVEAVDLIEDSRCLESKTSDMLLKSL